MNRRSQCNALLLSTAILLTLPAVGANALPTGGTVSYGTATITNNATISSPATATTINQTSANAIINWAGFNTTSGQTVTFKDPSSSSITLNRISGGETTFNGALNANGQVWFTNPEGFIFGSTAKVNVGSLLATTSNFTGAGGQYAFAPGGGSASATVSNAGSITVASAGLAALVAPHVANSGTITAKAGTITLASGDTFTVDLASDGLINLAASKAMTQQGLANTGTLNATGGSVNITAAQASGVLDNLINLNGVIEANNLTASNNSGDLAYGANFSGSTGGNVTLSAYRNITIDSGVQIAPVAGINGLVNNLNVSLDANDTAAAGGGAIYMASGSGINAGGGSITLGGGATPTTTYAVGNNAAGAKDENNSSVFSNGIYLNDATLTTTKTGKITLNGTGNPNAASGSNATGVNLNDSALTSTGNGAITINGAGGKTAKGSSNGIYMTNNSVINADGGSVTLKGTGGQANGYSADGILFNNSGISASANDYATGGNILLTGTGGTTAGQQSEGILLQTSGINLYQGGGSVTLNGTGGTGLNTTGVDLEQTGSNGFTSSETGALTFNGHGGTATAGGTDVGVLINGGTPGLDIYSGNGMTLTIKGTAGSGTGAIAQGAGIELANVNVSAGGAAVITGIASNSPGTDTFGIQLGGYANVSAGMLGSPITLTGTGSNGAAAIESDELLHGGLVNAIYAAGGPVTLKGLNNSLNLGELVITNEFIGNSNIAIDSFHDITLGAGSSIYPQSVSFNVTLDANDTGAAGGGSIYVAPGVSISTGGGNIVMGGGANPATGYAVGDTTAGTDAAGNSIYSNGIYLAGNLDADGGNITLNGKGLPGASASTPTNSTGITIESLTYTGAYPQPYVNNLVTLSTTGSGTISINGVGGTVVTGSSTGVNIDDAQITTQSGALAIKGASGPGQSVTGYNEGTGINLTDSTLSSTSGTLTLTGTTGADNGVATGLNITSGSLATTSGAINLSGSVQGGPSVTGTSIDSAAISSVTGPISISGTAAYTPSTYNSGLGLVLDYSTIASTGTASNASPITLKGSGASLGFDSFGSKITTIDGKVNITGNSPDVAGTYGYGVNMNGVEINSTGTGANAATVTISGTGPADAIQLTNPVFNTVDGNFTFNGTGEAGYESISVSSPTFNSTGKGTFNFNPGAILSE